MPSPNSKMPKVIFAIPGNSFTNLFLRSWADLEQYAIEQGHYVCLSAMKGHLPNVQNLVLGGDATKGRDQKPFQGRLDYTHVMFIDSDMVFRPFHYQALLSADEAAVSGVYMMEGGERYACGWNDEEYFKKYGYMRSFTQEDLDHLIVNGKGLATVQWSGTGWMLVKREALEKLSYPWFYYSVDGTDVKDNTMHDLNFCYDLRKVGYPIYIHPKIRVGHEKSKVY